MKIYVGNIPFSSTEADLRELFEQFGEVSSVKIITDRVTGRSRGFGFIEMPNDDEAQNAIASLDGKEFGGRPLRVNVSRPREDRGGPNRPKRW